MVTPTTARLEVPGASLYYEIRDRSGDGPVLLMIAGGNTDAGVFEMVADLLASTYRVATYDPRGNSRSPLTGPPVDQRIDQHSDDAAQLLAAVGDEPAIVFGSSSGGIVGLDLLVRHPDRVRLVIAHEPPVVQVLPDADQHRDFFDAVYQTYQRDGVIPALRMFAAGTGLGQQSAPTPDRVAALPPAAIQMMARMEGNMEFFLAHEVRPFTGYRPDLVTLRQRSQRLILGGGAESRQFLPFRPAAEIADRFGVTVTEFPGGHAGYATNPAEFAATLDEVIHHALAPATRPS